MRYSELIVWQKAMDLVTDIYKITAVFPSEERFGLSAQVRRAVVSIPSNIAERQAWSKINGFSSQFLGHSFRFAYGTCNPDTDCCQAGLYS